MQKEAEILLALVVFFLLVSFVQAYTGNYTLTVEANIIASPANQPQVSIVLNPDFVFFGNITKGQKSNETQVYVNNTGSYDVIVTPVLADPSEKIFNYTFFRTTKTSNGTEVPFTQIGYYNISVSKAARKYFYISLDLTNYTDDIPTDLIGHRSDIIFYAMSQ